MCDVYRLYDLYEESTDVLKYFERYNIPLDRDSADNTVNNYGYRLLEVCKNNNIFILNGRLDTDHSQPSLTCKNSSITDFFLSSAHVLPNIADFYVHEFSSLYSDAHCPVALILNIKCNEESNCNMNNETERKPRLWDVETSDSFIDNIDILKVSEIEIQLDKMLNAENGASKQEIDEIVLQIGFLFNSTARNTFGTKYIRTDTKIKNRRSCFKPWFNTQCFQALNLYHKSRKMYNKYKTEYYKNILKIVSKKYENIDNKLQTIYK